MTPPQLLTLDHPPALPCRHVDLQLRRVRCCSQVRRLAHDRTTDLNFTTASSHWRAT